MNNFLVECFFSLPSDLESVLNSAFFCTHIDLFEEKSFQLYLNKNIMLSIRYSFTLWFCLGGGDAVPTYMRRDAGEEGGCEFFSKMPRIRSNLPDFPRRPFLYAHLCVYTKSMGYSNRSLAYHYQSQPLAERNALTAKKDAWPTKVCAYLPMGP